MRREGWEDKRAVHAVRVIERAARSLTRSVRVCVDNEDVGHAGRQPITVCCKRASTHAICHAHVAQCVRGLSHVVGGLWSVVQTRMLGVLAMCQAHFLDYGCAL